MNKLPLYLAFLLLTQLAGCKIKDPFPKSQPPANPIGQLPPATQTGQYTFGCLVNGQAWLPAGSPFNGPLLTCQYLNKHLSVVARRNLVSNGVASREALEIQIDGISTAGLYSLNQKSLNFANYENLNTFCSYYTDALHPARVEITRMDLVERVVSGRFSFILETPGCDKAVVTDGRFDAKF